MEGEQGEEKEDGRERGCAESETQLKNHIFHACTHKNEYKI
jgi:hypothetical protein